MATSQNQTRTDDSRRYFSGNDEQPKQYQVYQCTCGAYQKRHSAQHWRSTNWQGSACNRCGKRVNLTWGKCQFFDSKEKAEEYIHNQYAGERLHNMGVEIVNNYIRARGKHSERLDHNKFEAYTDELYWINRQMYEDYLHLQKYSTTLAEEAILTHMAFTHFASPEHVARQNSQRHRRYSRSNAAEDATRRVLGDLSTKLPKNREAILNFTRRWLV